jgi:hypothetical protein
MTVTQFFGPSVAEPASRHVVDRERVSLSDAVEQLAGLRFAIVLSARWESSGALDLDDVVELRTEMRQLRISYSHKIDEIAMTFGVQAAIDAQAGVEREVTVPKNMAPPGRSNSAGFHDI